MLSVPGFADLVKRVYQGVFVLGLERNVKVDRGAHGRVTQALPVRWDGIPCVLNVYVVPTW